MTDRLSENYGKGEHSIDLAEELDVLVPGAAELLEIFRSPKYRPPVLPSVAMELLALSRKHDVEFAAILAVLERDPMVAARVLRIAQSPMFTTGMPVQSLKNALVRLGIINLTHIFLEVTMNLTIFRAPGYEKPMESLRRHSTATAYISRAVAHATNLSKELAFLCGLLHDVGMAACLISLGASAGKGKRPPVFEIIWPAVRDCHEEASELLAKLWHMDPEVQIVLGHHHHYLVEGQPHPLSAAVCVADWVASEAGASMEQHLDPGRAAAAAVALRLDERTMQELHAHAKQVVARLV